MSISSNAPSLYETGYMYVLITPSGYPTPSTNDELNAYRNFIIAHPRAQRISLKKLRGEPVRVTVPILSRIAYEKWQNAYRDEAAPGTILYDDPCQVVHVTFEGLPPHSVSNSNMEITMHEKMEFIHPAGSTTQQHHAKQAPSMAPGAVHRALDWMGANIDSAEAAIAHASATLPAIMAGGAAVGAALKRAAGAAARAPVVQMLEL
jgi:hypothetical protein